MRRTFTITVDVQDTSMVDAEDLYEELDYWDAECMKAIASVMRKYHDEVSLANDSNALLAIDFTTLSHRSDSEEELEA